MAAFVLHLGQQNGLAFERGRAGDPVTFGLHADDFAVGMLADLAHQGFAISLGHPVLRLNLAIGVDFFVERRLQRLLLRRHRGRHRFEPWGRSSFGSGGKIERLGVHRATPLGEHACEVASISINQPHGWLIDFRSVLLLSVLQAAHQVLLPGWLRVPRRR